jgi:hypothetical protein
MSWLSRFFLGNWSHLLNVLLLFMTLLCGMQMGESRVQMAWDAEKQMNGPGFQGGWLA